MYRAFVQRRLRRSFLEELNGRDYPKLVARTAPDVVHVFPGEGALGGTRTSRDALRLWFDRLFRLVPELRFEVDEMIVSGWPWRATVAVRWRNRGVAADGRPYLNAG